MTSLEDVRVHLHALADPEAAKTLERYFKTGPGEYGEGDRFLGIKVPVLRRLAREYQALPLADVTRLLESPLHEERMLALFVLVRAYGRGDGETREAIYHLYLGHTACVNNWDLVDSSAEFIVGGHVRNGDRSVLDTLARSDLVWERRIAIMATSAFIKDGEFQETLRLGKVLLNDRHDLIQKAVGWMLREVGERDQAVEEVFLAQHCRQMPRTMLRYAIEKFPEALRQAYLKGTVPEPSPTLTEA